MGFGIDSFIEVLSGSVLLWRMSVDADVEQRQRNEKRALRIVGLCFLGLAVYIAYESANDLVRHRALSHAEQIGPMLATKGLGALASYSPDGLRGLSILTLADVAGQAADNVCDKVHLPRSCLVLASGLINDMEKLGWHARSANTWVV